MARRILIHPASGGGYIGEVREGIRTRYLTMPRADRVSAAKAAVRWLVMQLPPAAGEGR